MRPRCYRLRRSEFGKPLPSWIIAPTEADAQRLAVGKYGEPIVLELVNWGQYRDENQRNQTAA